MARYKFIVNPAAGRGRCLHEAEKVKIFCNDYDLDHKIFYTLKSGDAITFAREGRDSFDCVVAVGGDGTINEVVNGLIGGRAKLGVVPVGSGNDFIKAVAIPEKLEKALINLTRLKSQKIDVGQAGDRYFINGLGIGFDAWVVKETLGIKKFRGMAIYLYAVLKTIYSFKPPQVLLRYDDISREEKFFMITVGNGISLGGGFKLTPQALIDDGLFDLNIVRDLNKWEIYKNLVSVFSGRHIYLPQVTTGRTTHLSVTSEEGFAVHADGELLSLHLKSLDIKLYPKALDVVVS